MTIFYGHSKELRFIPDNTRGYLDFLVQNEGKKLVVNMGLDKAKRSLDANAYYWLYLGVIARETGHTEEELHRIFKGLFLPKKPVVLKGKTYMLAGSTSDLNKPQFSEYLQKICAETNIPMPEQKLASDVIAYPTDSNQTLL
jgi:hypothetical protein